jgi:hypothetical protein
MLQYLVDMGIYKYYSDSIMSGLFQQHGGISVTSTTDIKVLIQQDWLKPVSK